VTKQLYYHPRLNVIGFTFGLDYLVKISEVNEYMVLTSEWVYIGDI